MSNRLATLQQAQQEANIERAIRQELRRPERATVRANKRTDSDVRASGIIPLIHPDPQADDPFPDANDNDSDIDDATNLRLSKRMKWPD